MSRIPALLLQNDGAVAGALIGSSLMMIIMLAVIGVAIAGLWKVFVKAGHPGWAVLVPIYNLLILLKIAGKPAWWIVLFVIPLANIIVGALVAIEIAKAFGQSAGWGIVMLFLLGGIGYLMLGFGNYQYQGGRAQVAAAGI